MILAHKAGIVSIRKLRDAIQELTGIHYLITTNPDKVKKLHLRYGSYAKTIDETDYNSCAFIKICCDKANFSKLVTKAELDAPIFRYDEPGQDDYPLLIRTTLHGYGGMGIVVCPNEDDFYLSWEDGDCWTKFTNTSVEYRIHIVDGEILKVFKKVYVGDDKEPDLPIRTLYSGNYHFSLRTNLDKFNKLEEVIYELNKVMLGKFYALDVGWQPDLKKYFFFEANSAPGLNTNTALALAKKLHQLGAV